MSLTMELSELISEHERLCDILANTINQLFSEYQRQISELADYKKMLNNSRSGGSDEYDNNKIAYVMREFKNGTLYDSHDNLVTNRKQAIAIALNEARKFP